MTPRLLQRVVTRYAEQAGARLEREAEQVADQERAAELVVLAYRLRQASPHQLRHSLARRLLHTGAKLTEVQSILGHSRLETTGMYLTASEDDLREAIGRAGVA